MYRGMNQVLRCGRLIPFLLGAALLVGLCATDVRSQTDSVRVMPLGDSITEAQGGYAAYRYWLWKDLENAGYPVDFVGSQYGVYSGSPPYTDYDQDHEGHWGWRADQILANIGSWAAASPPDIVLIHLGHNDLWQGQSVISTIDELGQIIDTIRVVNPDATFLIAQVIPSTPSALDSIPFFNAQLPDLALLKNTEQSPVLVVDQHSGFDPWTDTYDGVHPNEIGEIKMADRWFAPLDSVFTIATGVSSLSFPVSKELQFSNTPNPFNPTTEIRYSVAVAGEVRLMIYDVAGRLVVKLVEGHIDAGHHTITWNGRNSTGGEAASGTYFVRLESAGEVLTRKITLVG